LDLQGMFSLNSQAIKKENQKVSREAGMTLPTEPRMNESRPSKRKRTDSLSGRLSTNAI